MPGPRKIPRSVQFQYAFSGHREASRTPFRPAMEVLWRASSNYVAIRAAVEAATSLGLFYAPSTKKKKEYGGGTENSQEGPQPRQLL